MDANQPLDHRKINIAPLGSQHSIDAFRCGVDEIDEWARKYASKFNAINRIRVFCAHEHASSSVLGLYCLSFLSKETKRLRGDYNFYRNTGIPLIFITYIAVLRSIQRQKLGSALLVDALRRSYHVAEHVGFFGVGLRALNDDTARLYSRYGFTKVDENAHPLMLLPMQSLVDLFGPHGHR